MFAFFDFAFSWLSDSASELSEVLTWFFSSHEFLGFEVIPVTFFLGSGVVVYLGYRLVKFFIDIS